jgi:hypothetical protein
MLPRLMLVLALAGCAVDSGVVPSSSRVDLDIEGAQRAEARDVRDLRALRPGLPPPSHGADSFTPR